MSHTRNIAKKMVLFIYGMACFTDKLTTTILESLGLTVLALITIPLGCVNKLGLFVHHVLNLILDIGVLFLAMVILPVLRKIYGVLKTVIGFLFSGPDAEDNTNPPDAKWDPEVKF